MSTLPVLVKTCPFEGCDYVSKSTSSSQNAHNVGSHTSNFHAQKTRVWYGAYQVTILRDIQTKEMVCPCGEYRHQNASVVRRHAMLKHKAGTDATHKSKDHTSPVAIASQASSAQTGAASSHGAKQSAEKPAFTSQNKVNPPSTSVLQGRSSTSKSSAKIRSYPQPTAIAALKRPRETDVDMLAKSHEKDRKPAKAPRISTTTAASDLPVAGPSSSPRPISSWRQWIVPTAKCLPTSRARPARTAVDSEVRDSSIEDDEDMMPSSSSARPPLRGELECSRCFTTLECKPDDRRLRREWTCDACRSQPPRARLIPPGPRASHTHPVVRSEAGPSSVANASVRTGIIAEKTLHRDATSASSRNPSRPFTFTSLMPHPAVPRLSKAAPGPMIDSVASSDGNGGKSSDVPPPTAPLAKPRRTRVSKQMRAKQFRRWFDGILQEQRAQGAASSTAPGPGSMSNTCYRRIETLQKEGGTAYTTADEFFDALRQRVAAHGEKLKQGTKDVLHFCGGYAIVAQPKVGMELRLEQFKAQLRGAGLAIDSDHIIFNYDAHSDDDVSMSTTYSCSCGGISEPKPHVRRLFEDMKRIPVGPCWGTVDVEVGNDESLAMYGIKGQYMQVTISH